MSVSAPHIFTIDANLPPLQVLATSLLDASTRAAQFGDSPLEDYTILLPTRRAARSLAEIFIAQSRAQNIDALILPHIRPIGDIDDDGFAEFQLTRNNTLILPVACDARERHFWLMQCIRKWHPDLPIMHCSAWVVRLEQLLDEAYNQNIDWTRLPNIVPDNFADNWHETLEFLKIITKLWPEWLDAHNRIDAVARRNYLIEMTAATWQVNPPPHPVIALGSTGTIAASAELLRVIAHLANGAVILHGLDSNASDEEWLQIMKDAAHPQHAMACLLAHFDAKRSDVDAWGDNSKPNARVALLNHALAPANFAPTPSSKSFDMETALEGLHVFEAPDLRSEAGAIAVLMRETLESDNTHAALITPDSRLARRVSAELERWNILVDDSAGRPLAESPPAEFMRLILAAYISDFAAIDLLALLKHPLCTLGQNRGIHLGVTRDLERIIMRQLSVGGELEELRASLAMLQASDDSRVSSAQCAAISSLIDALAKAYVPIVQLGRATHPLIVHIDALRKVAIMLAKSDEVDGDTLLMRIDGRMLMQFFDDLHDNAALAPALCVDEWALLLADWLMAKRVRLPNARLHPRLSIWSPAEARLLQPDLIILGGLNEAVWPRIPDVGPWLSRPMRQAMQLPAPEQRIGLAAHDFLTHASASKVVLTRAQKIDGKPTIASRWLRRLQAFAPALDTHMAQTRLAWWQSLDTHPAPQPASRPAPCPPLATRPNKLSVTAIETLIADPYEIYARYILRLRELNPLSSEITALEYGSFLHKIFENFTTQYPDTLPDDIAACFVSIAGDIAAQNHNWQSVLRAYRIRIEAIAQWFATYEDKRRNSIMHQWAEIEGAYTLDIAGMPFTLTARADRIDQLKNNEFDVSDYKSGTLPPKKAVSEQWKPQLTLAAVILENGGFEGIARGRVANINYIKTAGGIPPGKVFTIDAENGALTRKARAMLDELITNYRNPKACYTAFLRPALINYERAYHQLARHAEWAEDIESDTNTIGDDNA